MKENKKIWNYFQIVLDWAEQTQSLLLAEQAQSSWPNRWATNQGCPLAKTLTEQAQSFWAHLLDNRQSYPPTKTTRHATRDSVNHLRTLRYDHPERESPADSALAWEVLAVP